MSIAITATLTKERPAFGLPVWTLAALLVGSMVILWTQDTLALTATALLSIIGVGGVLLIVKLSEHLDDDRVRWLGYIFLAKLVITPIVLVLGWVPMLDVGSISYGFDPQRYYFDAGELVKSGFNMDVLQEINYTGVIYYFALIFKIFGHNPIFPALINVFLSLVTAALILKMGYSTFARRTRHDWMLGMFIVIPDLIWYDCLTSKDTLVMFLLVTCIVPIQLFIIRKHGLLSKLAFLTVAAASTYGLIMIRPPMVGALLASIGCLAVAQMKNVKTVIRGVAITSVLLLAMLEMPSILGGKGGYDFNLADLAMNSFVKNEINEEFLQTFEENWSENSIGRRLLPNSVYEVILFAPFRIAAFLLSPLPNVNFDFESMSEGVWVAWQAGFTLLSSVVHLMLFPLLLAGLYHSMHHGGKEWTAFHLPFWCIITAVSLGTLFIHERYRIPAIPFFWGCAWLGLASDKETIIRSYQVTGLFFLATAVAYFTYKNVGALVL